MDYSICSYSLHRTFSAGDMDIFSYIDWCKLVGFTLLDPWNEHLKQAFDDDSYLAEVKAKADAVGLGFGCIAVDGAHIYEPTAEARDKNRQIAHRWIEIAGFLGAEQIRLDAGGRDVSFEEIFDIVVDGYKELVATAANHNLEVVIENHWGATNDPDKLHLLLDAVDGLGLLFDSYNWPKGTHQQAWPRYVKYARNTHFKTRRFDQDGNEPDWDIPGLIKMLQDAGYAGCWGIESVPGDGREIDAAVKTLALLKRVLEP